MFTEPGRRLQVFIQAYNYMKARQMNPESQAASKYLASGNISAGGRITNTELRVTGRTVTPFIMLPSAFSVTGGQVLS